MEKAGTACARHTELRLLAQARIVSRADLEKEKKCNKKGQQPVGASLRREARKKSTRNLLTGYVAQTFTPFSSTR